MTTTRWKVRAMTYVETGKPTGQWQVHDEGHYYETYEKAHAEELCAKLNAHAAMVEALETYAHDGRLQTFEDRQRFREAAQAALRLAKGDSA